MPRKATNNNGGPSNPKPNDPAPIRRETRSQAKQRQQVADELARKRAAEEARQRALQSSSDSPARQLDSQSPNASSLADGHRRSVALGAANSQGVVPPEKSGPSSRRPQMMARKNFTKIRGEFRGRVPPINVIMEKRGGCGAARHAAAIRGTISGTERTSHAQPPLPSNANGSVLNEADTQEAGPIVDVCSGATREEQGNDLDNGCSELLTNAPMDIPTMEMDLDPTFLGQRSTSAAERTPRHSLEAVTINSNASGQQQLEGAEGVGKAQDGATSIMQTEDLEIVSNMMMAMIKEVSMKTSIGEQEALLVNPELSADEPNNKRKAVASPQEPAKKNRPESIDTSSGKFVCFIFSSEKPSPKAFDELMKNLELVHMNKRNKFIYNRASSVCANSQLWGIEFLACDQLAERLTWLINHPNRHEELDRLNECSFGPEVTNYLHISGALDTHGLIKVSFLLLVQRIIGLAQCCVDGFDLIAQFGKRFTLNDVIKNYSKPAAKAFELLNNKARKFFPRLVLPDAFHEIQPRLGDDTVLKLEALRSKLNSPGCTSFLQHHLTKEVVDKLKTRRTGSGLTFYECIKSSEMNTNAQLELFAATPDTYERFAPLFDSIIETIHGFGKQQAQPPVDLGESEEFLPLDCDDEYIISTRIRCIRNIKGYPWNKELTKNQYLGIEGCLKKCFSKYNDEDLKGRYSPLTSQAQSTENNNFVNHLLNNDRLRKMRNANSTNYWPVGRGMFRNTLNTFYAYVNCEDHIRLISEEPGCDVGRVWRRLNRGLAVFGEQMFHRDSRLGWLTSSPANLGSTVRASVKIRLPKLAVNNNVEAISCGLNLEARKIQTPEQYRCTYIIRNKDVMGVSEASAVRQMIDGVKQILRLERELA